MTENLYVHLDCLILCFRCGLSKGKLLSQLFPSNYHCTILKARSESDSLALLSLRINSRIVLYGSFLK